MKIIIIFHFKKVRGEGLRTLNGNVATSHMSDIWQTPK
jgi:hypothetical protein